MRRSQMSGVAVMRPYARNACSLCDVLGFTSRRDEDVGGNVPPYVLAGLVSLTEPGQDRRSPGKSGDMKRVVARSRTGHTLGNMGP